MTADLVQRAHWDDLEGQNWAVLVRLSLEADDEELSATAPGRKPDHPTSSGEKWRPATGRDIKSREEQEKDARRFVESRGGRDIYTYEEPDTSAWKRKRVRQPDGTVAYRVIRPVFEGALEDLKRGKGSFVRPAGQPALTLERRISRTAEGAFVMPNGDAWDEAEEPSTYRTRTTKDTGRLLQLGKEEALFACDRLLIDPSSGTRAMHRTLIPFTTAEAIPLLAEEPSTRPAAIYGLLTQDGHKLTWSETVRARMPLPDERTTLRLPDATPVLHLARVTHGTDGSPLLLEELRTGADRAELAYRITADKQPTRRARA